MKKLLVFLVVISLFFSSSCDEKNQEEEKIENVDLFSAEVDFKEAEVKELIISRIKCETSDIALFELHKAHLNADAVQDGYVVLNLANRAKRDMEKSSNPARFQDAGYIGDYNFIYVWDGKTKQLGTAFKLVGNGLTPLKVTASNFLDPGYKSLSAEYRVQNSIFETFFMNVNGQLIPVFSYTKVDRIGTPEMKVSTHKFQENNVRIQKDILVVKGLLANYDDNQAALNRNTYDIGTIKATDEIIFNFFFDDVSQKYATNASPELLK